MKSFKMVAAAIGAVTTIFAGVASAQGGGVLLPIRITNASGNVADMSLAADGNPNTAWNSGGTPYQWIDIDLGSERMISKIRMLPSQNPDGEVHHKVWGRDSNGQMFLITETSEYHNGRDNEWIELFNSRPSTSRYLVIQTVKSPSWVAWREFQVYDGGDLVSACDGYTYDKYGWALYASTTNGCAFQKTKNYYRDVSNLPTGATAETCYFDNLNGKYGLIPNGYRGSAGQCQGYSGSKVWLFTKQ